MQLGGRQRCSFAESKIHRRAPRFQPLKLPRRIVACPGQPVIIIQRETEWQAVESNAAERWNLPRARSSLRKRISMSVDRPIFEEKSRRYFQARRGSTLSKPLSVRRYNHRATSLGYLEFVRKISVGCRPNLCRPNFCIQKNIAGIGGPRALSNLV